MRNSSWDSGSGERPGAFGTGELTERHWDRDTQGRTLLCPDKIIMRVMLLPIVIELVGLRVVENLQTAMAF